MLDVRLIRENAALVRERLATRNAGDDAKIPEVVALDEERRKLLGFGELLLAHERADLLRDAIARGLELFDLGKQLAPLLIQCQHLRNLGLVSAVSSREPFTHEIGIFPDQPHIKHRGSIGIDFFGASAGEIAAIYSYSAYAAE